MLDGGLKQTTGSNLTDAETTLLFLFRCSDDRGKQLILSTAALMYQYCETVSRIFEISVKHKEERYAED